MIIFSISLISFDSIIQFQFDLEHILRSHMEKFNIAAVNHLYSFEKAEQLSKMTKQQRQNSNNQIKKQAAYFMLSVSRAVENKDYKTAKSILIYIADSCSCIEDPDLQVKYLIQVCCQHLAYIREMEGVTKQKNNGQTRSVELKSEVSHNPLIVFRYNKFKGEFECDDVSRGSLNQTILFYMSKINAILFNYQNTQNHHSLVAMLLTYYPYFLMVIILMFILFIFIFSGMIEVIMGVNNSSFEGQIPVVIVCFLFVFPLLKIYLKQPVKKDSNFFEKKLGQKITKINQQCADNNENIKFFMQGIQINVLVTYSSSDRSSQN